MIRDSIDEIRSRFFHTLNPSVMKGSVRVTPESPVCNSSRNTRIEILGIIVSQVVTIVGVPSYTSGAQLWNGAAAILNRKPTTVIVRPIVTGPVILSSVVTDRRL
jgi:hypothetical protein